MNATKIARLEKDLSGYRRTMYGDRGDNGLIGAVRKLADAEERRSKSDALLRSAVLMLAVTVLAEVASTFL